MHFFRELFIILVVYLLFYLIVREDAKQFSGKLNTTVSSR